MSTEDAMNNKTLSDTKWDNLHNYSSIEAIYPNGQRITLSYIDATLPNAEWKIKDAQDYYASTMAVNGVTIETTSDTFTGKDQLKEVKEWSSIRESLTKTTINDELFKKLLGSLQTKNISSVIISDLLKEWDIRKNENNFIDIVKKTYSPTEQTLILKALELIKKVHSAPQKDDKPEVPYYNHPVVVATYAIQLKLGSDAVIAALLHDVVEDTAVTPDQLRKVFSQKSVDYVIQLTKKKDEDRNVYLSKFPSYTDDIKLIKALDRYHNLLRAFTFMDKPKYWEQYINETEKYFYPEFMKNQTLLPFVLKFYMYLEELKKLLAA